MTFPLPQRIGAPAVRQLIGALDWVNRAATILVGLLLAIASVSVTWQILVRMVLDVLNINLSAPWTEEIARYAMIWTIFIGVGVLSRHAALIAVEILPQMLAPPWGRAVKLLAVGITAVFFGFLVWIGGQFALDGLIETSPVLRLPMTGIYAALPIGAILAVLNLLVFALEALLRARDITTPDTDTDTN